MAVELGGITLEHLTHVAVTERARVVRHAVPGLNGELAQVAGRPSVEVRFRGLFSGPTAADDLTGLRRAFTGGKPLDFFTEAVGEGYFAQVLITELHTAQVAGFDSHFEFACAVVEYVEPPAPALADPLGALDAGLLDEAGAFMDDAQNGLAAVSELTDLAASFPAIADPTGPLKGMLDGFTGVAGEGGGALAAIRDLF